MILIYLFQFGLTVIGVRQDSLNLIILLINYTAYHNLLKLFVL